MSWTEHHASRFVEDQEGNLVEVDFAGYRCQLLMDRFASGGLCLRLVDLENNDQIARATVCLPASSPPHGCVYIKDYGENEGLLDTLCRAGVVTDTGERAPSGFAELAIARLSPFVQQQFAGMEENRASDQKGR